MPIFAGWKPISPNSLLLQFFAAVYAKSTKIIWVVWINQTAENRSFAAIWAGWYIGLGESLSEAETGRRMA
jgi:hypothetical protein